MGSLFFSIFLCLSMYIYISLYKIFTIGLVFTSGTLQNPIYSSFIFGLIIGGILGFFLGLFINAFGIDNIYKGGLSGFIFIEILVIGIYLFFTFFDEPNPITLIFKLIDNLYELFKVSLVFIIPSILSGAVLGKLNALFAQN